MIFPTKANWQEWGISHEAHKFFLLRWQEIFDEETFDSWQVRSSNTRTILKEILEATRVVEKVHVYHPNIKALIDEAIQTAKNDNIISESFPFVFDYLKKLNTAYETKVKNQEKQDIESFRRLILVILGNSDKYREKLFNRFKELISNPPDQYKTKLYSLTIALGIELKSIGYSISSLRDSFQILIDSSEPDFIKRFEKLIKKYSGKSHKYECQFLVSWPGDFPNLGRYNIELLKQRPNILLSEEEKKFFDQDIQATIALVYVGHSSRR